MKIRAPAKINLTLRIIGRRGDGYHLIDTVMVPIALYDELELRKLRIKPGKTLAEPIQVVCNHPALPVDDGNLVYRAAKLVTEIGRNHEPIRIRLKKRIPIGAGLGGGSSDAAATLVGLNHLLDLRLSTRRLEQLAVQLGTDVPFFIRRQPARARGIGERLRIISSLPPFWVLVVYPGFPVPTAWAYRQFAAKLTKRNVNTSIATSPKTFDELLRRLHNDLEDVTLEGYPKIAEIKRKLLRGGAPGVLMSGSGSSVFGIFKSRKAALEVFRRVRQEEGAQKFLVRALI